MNFLEKWLGKLNEKLDSKAVSSHTMVKALDDADKSGQPLLAEEYAFLARAYKKGVFGTNEVWKWRAYEDKAKRNGWLESELKPIPMPAEGGPISIPDDYDTEKAEFYLKKGDIAVSNYYALEGHIREDDRCTALIMKNAPEDARIPNGEEDVIRYDVIRQRALMTGNPDVFVSEICNEMDEDRLPSEAKLSRVKLYADNGMLDAQRCYASVVIAKALSSGNAPSKEENVALFSYELNATKEPNSEVLRDYGWLYKLTGKNAAKMVDYFRRSLMLRFFCPEQELDAIIAALESAAVTLPGDNALHIRFFQFVRNGEKE